MGLDKVFIVIPAYNAERTLADVVSGLRKYCHPSSIIVVNDGSQDGTKEIKNQNIIYLEHDRNYGKGSALKTGFSKALSLGAKFIVTVDADGQHDAQDVSALLEKMEMESLDLLIGSRMSDTREMPFLRRLSNRWTSKLISWRIGQRIEDSQCGLRVHRATLVRELSDRIRCNHFDFETEILLRAARKGFKIGFRRIRTIYPEKYISTMSLVDVLNFIKVYLSRLEP